MSVVLLLNQEKDSVVPINHGKLTEQGVIVPASQSNVIMVVLVQDRNKGK